jgi:hypothetical protein
MDKPDSILTQMLRERHQHEYKEKKKRILCPNGEDGDQGQATLNPKVGWHERQQSCSVSRMFQHRNHRRVALADGTSTGELGQRISDGLTSAAHGCPF